MNKKQEIKMVGLIIKIFMTIPAILMGVLFMITTPLLWLWIALKTLIVVPYHMVSVLYRSIKSVWVTDIKTPRRKNGRK